MTFPFPLAWNGSTVAATRPSGAVWTVRYFFVADVLVDPRVHRDELNGGEVEDYEPLEQFARPFRLVVEADVSALTGSSPTDNARLRMGWREATEFFDPKAGRGTLTITVPDLDGGTEDWHLLCNVRPARELRLTMAEPKGIGESGAYAVAGAPYFIYVVEGDTRFPYWIAEALLDEDVDGDPAELVSNSATTITVDNTSPRDVGIRLVIKSASVTGSPTTFTLTNNTTGATLVMTKGSAMAAGEYVDFHASDPLAIDKSSGWTHGSGHNFVLVPGENELELVATGGTFTGELSWPAYEYSA